MKVVVLGAGVIGVTTAYYLARAGAEVTVIDRQRAAAVGRDFGIQSAHGEAALAIFKMSPRY